jgi:c-di-GMP-related signal transduction protein
VGLFSMMDAFLGVPLQRILSQVSLPQECSAALLGERNRLRQILDLIIAYEREDWSVTLDSCARLHIDAQDLVFSYMQGVQWVDSVLSLNLDGPVVGQDPALLAPQAAGNGLRPM